MISHLFNGNKLYSQVFVCIIIQMWIIQNLFLIFHYLNMLIMFIKLHILI